MRGKKLLVALAGQPNTGKSTIFNILTGLSQHVGNWPGKTVEKKEGVHISGDVEMRIVDLPGTYSLTAFSEEERIARDFVANESPDVVVLVANASALEKSLYLLSELLLLGPPVVVAMNMMDVAEGQGIHIDTDSLSKALGIPVIPMVATRNKGIKELVSTIISIANREMPYKPSIPHVSKDHMDLFNSLADIIGRYLPPPRARWAAIKAMEGDPEVCRMLEEIIPEEEMGEIRSSLSKHEDSLFSVVHGRYDWIEGLILSSVSSFKKGQILTTDRIDHILTRPVFGIPILLGVLALVFILTYKLGSPIQGWLEWVMSSIGVWIGTITPSWAKGLIVDGIIGGVGTVLTFIPILLIFFATMAFLEDVGYMARAAFVMDRFMHVIGLHGKSFLPLFLGFGCNLPAVLGARIVESGKARLLTIFLAPFVPCTARLAALTFIAAAVFGKDAPFVSWSLVAINIIALGISGMIVSRVVLRGEPMPFVMELPLYHRPDLRTIGIVVWNRTKAFVKRAGTVILGVSALVWVLSNVPGGGIEGSVLGWIGRALAPLGSIMGLDWKMMVALLTSYVAKENCIATLGVLYGVGEEGLGKVLPLVMTRASALSFLVALMLFIPCVATSVVMWQEMRNRRLFAFSFIFMLLLSLGAGAVAYRLAMALGL
jgi:ferrous iron transport protein B